jgi:hypothetical protein
LSIRAKFTRSISVDNKNLPVPPNTNAQLSTISRNTLQLTRTNRSNSQTAIVPAKDRPVQKIRVKSFEEVILKSIRVNVKDQVLAWKSEILN